MLITAAFLAVSGIGVLAGSAGAQSASGDPATFCADRIEANSAEGKAANLAIIDKMVTVAPPAVVQPMTSLRDAYKKKGEKLFNSGAGFALLSPVDAWVYDKDGVHAVANKAMKTAYGLPESGPGPGVQFANPRAGALECTYD